MNGFDWKYALNKLLVLITSRKFLIGLFAVLAAFGLDINEELKALILMVVAAVFQGAQAYEDANK